MSTPAGRSRGSDATIVKPLLMSTPVGRSRGAQANVETPLSVCVPLNDIDVCCTFDCGHTYDRESLDNVDILKLIEQMSGAEARNVLVKLTVEHPHLDWWNYTTFHTLPE